MSIYPTVRPSLTLDFQKSKQLDPRISFSRSSTATYVEGGVIKYADEHQARFEDKGLLMEEIRTNSIVQSQALDTSPWFPLNGTIASSTELSPDGTANAYRLTASSNNCYNRYIITNAGSDYTFSAFIKAGNVNWARLYAFGGYVDFDLHNVTVGFVRPEITGYGIDQVADGWVRCWVSTASTSVTQVRIYPLVDSNDSTTSSGDYIDLYGAQLEENATFPTSYIPTSGSTVTRAVDIAQITGDNFSSWYNQNEGTVVASIVNGNTTGASSIWSFDNGTSNNRWMFRFGAGVNTTNFSTLADTIKPYTATHACAIEDNGLSYAKDGVLFSPPTTVGVFLTGKTTLNLGDGPGVNPSTGHISRLSYYSERLTNEQLEAITS